MNGRPRILRVSLTTAEPERLAAFYERAMGFERTAVEERAGPDFSRLMGIEGARARAVMLRLGGQEVELLAFADPGKPYPSDGGGNDLRFQHIAIAVRNMRDAYARLSASRGWTPITRRQPQQLPATSGGVTAFKFRDPEGHPLELLEFPRDRAPPAWQAGQAGPCLGIDHSAISVADSARSIDFYRRRLGFSVAARTLNRGPEQERLDGLPGAVVDVTALANPAAPPPHLELLCYRSPPVRRTPRPNGNDIAATRLVLEATPTDESAAALLHDPDGHALCLASRRRALSIDVPLERKTP